MQNPSRHSAAFKPRPAPSQPGTLREQLRTIAVYLRLPAYYRAIDAADAWEFARQAVLSHARAAA